MKWNEKLNGLKEYAETLGRNRNIVRGRKKVISLIVSLVRILFLISLGYIILYPVFSALSAALKPEKALFDVNLYWLPADITFDNFKIAFQALDFSNTFMRTLSLNVVSAIIEVGTCAVTAYGFARFNFKLKKPLQMLLILSILIPMQFYVVSIVANYKSLDVFGILGLFNKISGIDLRPNILNTNLTFYLPSLFSVGLRSGILIYIYMQFFSGLPKELEEAAWMDGAGPFKTFIRIAIPSSSVVIIVNLMFSLIWHYNDYYLSVMFFSEKFPMAVQLANLKTALESSSALFLSYSTALKQNIIMAACLIYIVPLLILYLFAQKKFVQSIDRIGITG